MDKIMLSRACPDSIDGDCRCTNGWLPCDGPFCNQYNALKKECETGGTQSRPMTPSEQRAHHKCIIGRANQSVTAPDGFADNSIFFKTVVQEAHTFTDKHSVEWAVSLI